MTDNDDFFRDAQLRMDRLWKQLADAPIETIAGVVSPLGAGGGADGQSNLWTLTFSFACWHGDQAPIDNRMLTVRMRVTQNKLKKLMDKISPYAVLKIQARLITDDEVGLPQAELVKLIGVTADPELEHRAAKLQEPVTIQDERFGTLTLDRRLDRYDAKADWNGREITLTLETVDGIDVSLALSAAKRLFDEQASWMTRINEFAINKLHGRTWLEEEDEVELTRDEFLARIKLTSISMGADGHFDFWHDDGELFWGHCIQIYGDLADGLKGIDTPG